MRESSTYVTKPQRILNIRSPLALRSGGAAQPLKTSKNGHRLTWSVSVFAIKVDKVFAGYALAAE